MPQLRAADAIADETPLSVVLIDSALVVSIPKEELVGSKVILIDGDGDVIEQITVALDGLTDLDVVRVISHGSDGALWFGGQALDAGVLEARQAEVAGWGKSLAFNAQILLYGCRVAETDQGRSFVNELATMMHARVAASTDVTGMGGDTPVQGMLANMPGGQVGAVMRAAS